MERNKKIVIFTYDNFPFGGAPANFIRYFAMALAQQNLDVEVILPTGNNYGCNVEVSGKRKGFTENIPYKHLFFKKHPRNYIGKFLDIILGLILPFFYVFKANFKKKIDKIIVYNTSVSITLIMLFIKLIFRIKIIIIIPEFYEKPKCKYFSLSLLKWYNFYFGMKYLLRYADGYIVLSTYLKKYLEVTLKVNKPVFILPNIMDPLNFSTTESKPFISGKITIGYTGSPTRKDGVMDLIQAFSVLHKKHPATHLLIIGDVINGNSLIPQLKEEANKLGVAESITFTGLQAFSKIPELLNACQILTLTRPNGIFAEAGFPTKLGEYFACKKPVVITGVGDIPYHFKNEEHLIIVTPEDIESIVNGFEKLIMNPELSEKLVVNAFHWMDLHLNYKNIGNKLAEFIIK
jgi:glycosyltransferase involved in cell wall biosynthesis